MKEINKEIEKTFTETDSLMGVLYNRFKGMVDTGKILEEKKNLNSDLGTHSSSGSSSNDDLLVKISSVIEKLLGSEKDIEIRLNHLFDSSQPAPNEEERLHFSFYELQEILIKLINGLPGLVDEKGEMNQELLTLITNFLAGVEKLEKGQEKWVTIPTDKGPYTLGNLSEKERLENELKKANRKIDELRKEVASLKAAEEDRKDQQRQASEKEQQTRNEVKNELERISRAIVSPNKLTAEELANLRKKFQEMKNLLNSATKEQILKKTIGGDEYGGVKEDLKRIKLNLKRCDIKQAIADALADKGAEKPVVVKREELLEERCINYSQTLDEMDNSDEMDKFKEEILQVIAVQRNVHLMINNALSEGEKAIKNNDVEGAIKNKLLLLDYRKSHLKIFLSKGGEPHILIVDVEFLISKQGKMMAQIEQPTK